jgi:hypothetical protein
MGREERMKKEERERGTDSRRDDGVCSESHQEVARRGLSSAQIDPAAAGIARIEDTLVLNDDSKEDRDRNK